MNLSDPDVENHHRPTVVCRNDALAFPAVTYSAELQ
jgi:hypothetical protein